LFVFFVVDFVEHDHDDNNGDGDDDYDDDDDEDDEKVHHTLVFNRKTFHQKFGLKFKEEN
jgi:hypothetical protein